MASSQIRKRLSAGLLLAVFLLSATPKKTLHDLFAHHKDLSLSCISGHESTFLQSGFRCHCENLVVESPFVAALQDLNANPPAFREQMVRTDPVSCLLAVSYRTVLRGPPAHAHA